MTASLAQFLPDFEMPGLQPVHVPLRVVEQDLPPAAPPQPEIDVEAIRAEAHAEGEAAARAELMEQHQAECEAIEARYAAELQALKAEMETLAAQTIPEAISARSADIADLLAGDIAEILKPLIDETMRARILERLAEEIRNALELEAATKIAVSGPEGLVSALSVLLGADAERLTITHNDNVEIEIEIDRSRFSSRISEWAQALRESFV